MSSSNLHRFHTAQAAAESGYHNALAEIRGPGKRTHWIWYIFPQLAGLGRSPEARRYGIAGRSEAKAYLQDPVLRSRLLEITNALAERLDKGGSLLSLLGSSIDVLKLVSSMTLFVQVSRELQTEQPNAEYSALAEAAQRVLEAASEQGYPECAFTRRALATEPNTTRARDESD
jgi:uncharacterized protein (DUF1810 family)